MKFSPYGIPIPLVSTFYLSIFILQGEFHPEILTGSPERASNKGGG